MDCGSWSYVLHPMKEDQAREKSNWLGREQCLVEEVLGQRAQVDEQDGTNGPNSNLIFKHVNTGVSG